MTAVRTQVGMKYLCNRKGMRRHRQATRSNEYMAQTLQALLREINASDARRGTKLSKKVDQMMSLDERSFLMRMGAHVRTLPPSFITHFIPLRRWLISVQGGRMYDWSCMHLRPANRQTSAHFSCTWAPRARLPSFF